MPRRSRILRRAIRKPRGASPRNPDYPWHAEGEGFEPSVPRRAQRFSRPPRSTTPAPLRGLSMALSAREGKIARLARFRAKNQQAMRASVPQRLSPGSPRISRRSMQANAGRRRKRFRQRIPISTPDARRIAYDGRNALNATSCRIPWTRNPCARGTSCISTPAPYVRSAPPVALP